MELTEEPHPLVSLLVAVRQHQDGGLLAAGGGQVGGRHLRGKHGDGHRGSAWPLPAGANAATAAELTLKIQGMSLRLAWMTSEAKTELTENSSSLKRKELV